MEAGSSDLVSTLYINSYNTTIKGNIFICDRKVVCLLSLARFSARTGKPVCCFNLIRLLGVRQWITTIPMWIYHYIYLYTPRKKHWQAKRTTEWVTEPLLIFFLINVYSPMYTFSISFPTWYRFGPWIVCNCWVHVLFTGGLSDPSAKYFSINRTYAILSQSDIRSAR